MRWLAILAVACTEADADGDGWITPGDCDDGDPLAHPEAYEIPYDGIDQDCDGLDISDQDEDGHDSVFAGGDDCDDFRETVHPGADDEPYDGIDGDCDGSDDFDLDGDGHDAAGHGGTDCDDRDPEVVPEDLDGDGTDPCSGDCDETDPARHEGAERVCGNGVDDDCDGVSDCTIVGVQPVSTAPVRLEGAAGLVEHGLALIAPGDLTGDGAEDLVVLGRRAGIGVLSVYAGPLAAGVHGSDTAPIELASDVDEVVAVAAGDLDGDTRVELLVGEPDDGAGAPRVRLVGSLPPGPGPLAGLTLLEVVGDTGDETGHAGVVIGDRLGVGAPGRGEGEVHLLDASTRGTVAFGDGGAVLRGEVRERAGTALFAYEADGDGVPDLAVGASGDGLFASAVYLVLDPPDTGTHDLETFADARIDALPWVRAGEVLSAGDLDGDGADDVILGAPSMDGDRGAVAIFTERPAGAVDIDDAEVQRVAIGDDFFGAVVLARDFDDDGAADLVVGAPATYDSGGGPDKPGAAHVWYGPVSDGVALVTTADLTLEGDFVGSRIRTGASLAATDLDGDGGTDLAVGAPLDGTGVVWIVPGGQSALLGW